MRPALTFVVPVRHHHGVSGWSETMVRMRETARSIAAQTSGNWACVFVASRDTPMPTLPKGVEVVRVDLPRAELPDGRLDQEARFEAIRADKGRRVLAGILAAEPPGHVMIADFDDFVSKRLAAFVEEHAGANGWYMSSGYVYDGSNYVLRMAEGFDAFCGTSLIIRAGLFDVPASLETADETYLRQWFGSHKFAKAKLAEAGHGLSPLPFDGAVYRLGSGVSGVASIRSVFLPRWFVRRRPSTFLRNLAALRPVSARFRGEFLATSGERSADARHRA